MNDVLPIDFAREYAQSGDFPHACEIAGITPETDPERRVAQAQELIRTDPTLVEVLSADAN